MAAVPPWQQSMRVMRDTRTSTGGMHTLCRIIPRACNQCGTSRIFSSSNKHSHTYRCKTPLSTRGENRQTALPSPPPAPGNKLSPRPTLHAATHMLAPPLPAYPHTHPQSMLRKSCCSNTSAFSIIIQASCVLSSLFSCPASCAAPPAEGVLCRRP
jgi:hypothetical protein